MRLIIIEDEPLIAQRLERYCREILGTSLEHVDIAGTFELAAVRLEEAPVDVLLLDLNLEGCDGMELLNHTVAGAFLTIIVSANTDRALEAFEYGVIDFVPKPFSKERLAQAFRRITEPGGRSAHAARKLGVRKHGRIELVDLDEVVYVQGAGKYSELVLTDGRKELHDKTLEKLELILPPDFERVHKSYLVRLSLVKALHASEGSHYELELRNGSRLPIGRARYKDLREKLIA